MDSGLAALAAIRNDEQVPTFLSSFRGRASARSPEAKVTFDKTGVAKRENL